MVASTSDFLRDFSLRTWKICETTRMRVHSMFANQDVKVLKVKSRGRLWSHRMGTVALILPSSSLETTAARRVLVRVTCAPHPVLTVAATIDCSLVRLRASAGFLTDAPVWALLFFFNWCGPSRCDLTTLGRDVIGLRRYAEPWTLRRDVIALRRCAEHCDFTNVPRWSSRNNINGKTLGRQRSQRAESSRFVQFNPGCATLCWPNCAFGQLFWAKLEHQAQNLAKPASMRGQKGGNKLNAEYLLGIVNKPIEYPSGCTCVMEVGKAWGGYVDLGVIRIEMVVNRGWLHEMAKWCGIHCILYRKKVDPERSLDWHYKRGVVDSGWRL